MAKKLMALTPEQHAAMGPFAQEWIARGLSTEPADRARVERGIIASYRYAKLDPPKRIVWVDSPSILVVAAPTAAFLLSLHPQGEKNDAVDGAVRGAVNGAVNAAVDAAVGNAVGDAVRVAVGNAVGAAVGNAVGDAVRVAVRDAVDDAVSAAVGGAVDAAVGNAVGGAVRVAVRAAVGDAVSVAVDDAVGVAVSAVVGDAVNAAVDDAAVRGAVNAAVGDAVRGAVRVARSAQGPRATKEIRDALLDTIRRGWAYYLGGRWWGGGWYYWGMAYVAFFRDVVGLKLPGDTWDRSHAYADMMSAGWLWPHKDFVMVCEPPVTLHLEDRLMPGQRWRRLHNEHGPAIAWRDGTALWSLRGMSVPQQLVESPETITAEQIATERNAEVRRVMLDRFTAARFVREIGATIVDAHELHGKLYRYDQRDDEAVCVLEVVNASPEPIGYEAGPNDVVRDGRVWKTYVLRVPPTCSTALEARAWTFDIAPKDFSPLVES